MRQTNICSNTVQREFITSLLILRILRSIAHQQKLKLAQIFGLYIFYVSCYGYNIQKSQIFLLRAKSGHSGPFAKISSRNKFPLYGTPQGGQDTTTCTTKRYQKLLYLKQLYYQMILIYYARMIANDHLQSPSR